MGGASLAVVVAVLATLAVIHASGAGRSDGARAAGGSAAPSTSQRPATSRAATRVTTRATTSRPPSRSSTPKNLIDATDLSGRGIEARFHPHPLSWLRQREPDISFTVHTLVVGRFKRVYVVAAPPHPSGKLPAVVYLHGVHAAIATEMARDDLLSLPRSGKAVLIYPAGYEQSYWVGTDNCCGGAASVKPDDVAFVKAAVADAQRTSPVDPKRTYLIGFSNGGKLAYNILCTSSTQFAAAAIMSAMPLLPCHVRAPARLPMWLGVGTADQDLPRHGAVRPPVPQLDDVTADWRARDGCASSSRSSKLRIMTTTAWACPHGSEVRRVVYDGVGHVWPPASSVGASVAAGPVVWAFLSRFRVA